MLRGSNSVIVYSRSVSVLGITDDFWLWLFFSCKNRIFGIIMLFF